MNNINEIGEIILKGSSSRDLTGNEIKLMFQTVCAAIKELTIADGRLEAKLTN